MRTFSKRLGALMVALAAGSWVAQSPGQVQGKDAAPASQPSAAVQAPAPPQPEPPDILTDAVDPYNPSAQRALFFGAAGPDSEMDTKEYAADRDKITANSPPTATFARRFDHWSGMLAFDKNRNETIDWFEADAYRRDMRSRILGAYDKDNDGRLTGAERAEAIRALAAGRIPPRRPDPRLVLIRPGTTPPAGPPIPGGSADQPARSHLPPMPGDQSGHNGGRRSATDWRRFDRDGDGQLGPEERNAMVAAMRQHEGDQKFVKQFDLDGDGELSDEEKDLAIQKIREQQRAETMARYDKDGDGQLSKEERAAMQEEQGGELREAIERWQLRDFDANGNGQIDEDEKADVKAFQKQMQDLGKDLRLAMADLDGDGKVSPDEEKAVAREWRAAGWRMMIKAARYMDADGDGQVSAEERIAFGQRAGAAMIKWADKFSMSFDANGDGRLNKDERTAMVAGLKQEFLDRSAKFDADKDGRLSPDEAMEMMEAFAKEIGIEPPNSGKDKPARPSIQLPERFRKRPEAAPPEQPEGGEQ